MPVATTSKDKDALKRKLMAPRQRARLIADRANRAGGENIFMAQSAMDEAACRELESWYSGICRVSDQPEMFRQCRKFSTSNDFVRSVVALKKLLFNQGLTIEGAKTTQQAKELKRFISDLWTEWLTCDNAVAAWVVPSRPQFPFITVANCEDCQYSDALGVESLKLKLPKLNLTDAAKARLDRRYTDAIRSGNFLEWGGDNHPAEQFSVLLAGVVHPGGKAGGGLGTPSLWSIFDALATYALLAMSDRSASWMAKDIIRTISKGHEIKGGPLEGQATYFLKKREKKIIHDEMAGKSGAFDVVKNFDVLFDYVMFDNKFFDADKWKGVVDRILRWAGPVGYLFAERKSETALDTGELMRLLSIEAASHREAVREFTEQVGGMCGVPGLKVTFSSSTFMTWEQLVSFANNACGSGLMSPQTGREHLGLNHDQESKRLIEAHAKPLTVTPVFQRAQGQTGEPPGEPKPQPQEES